MEEKFNLAEYLSINGETQKDTEDGEHAFQDVLKFVKQKLDQEWENAGDDTRGFRLEKETRAIIGCEEEVRFYKEKIKSILMENRLMACSYPAWFLNLTEAVFAELYGLSGLASWAYDMLPEYRHSSSAKLIGERMYCLIDGKSELQPQRIPRARREKLKRTLLLATPEERVEYGFHEVYLMNGIRVTIYSGSRTKPDQDVIVMRKYLLKDNLTFSDLEKRNTIPPGSSALFICMVRLGFNIMFVGEVRSGKTTMMQTWQRYEDPSLEGLAVASDPETPWHEIMPEAPIMQLMAEGEELLEMLKSILRGDNDYVLLEEMRDVYAYRMFLDILSTGTRRSKATIHDQDAVSAAYKIASKIREHFGGDQDSLIAQVYQNVDYVFECCQDPEDRSRKILKGIVEFSYDVRHDLVSAVKICEFDFSRQTWTWKAHMSPSIRTKINAQGEGAEEMRKLLKELEQVSEMENGRILFPAYYSGNRNRNPGGSSPAFQEMIGRPYIQAEKSSCVREDASAWNG